MNLIRKTVCSAIVLAASSSVIAADLNLSVGGRVLPGSCTPSFSGGGLVDYGQIKTSFLGRDFKALDKHELDFMINCSAPMKVAFTQIAGRPGTVALRDGEIENQYGFGTAPFALADGSGDSDLTQATGLGLDASDNKIGGVAMNILQGATVLDGDDSVRLVRTREGWESYLDKNSTRTLTAPDYYTWALSAADRNPLPFTSVTSKMSVQAYLNSKYELDLSKEINLDGLVTFELKYL